MANDNQAGTHWVALYDVRPTICIYFDSFGAPPPNEVMKMMKATKKNCVYSNFEVQNYFSQNCGYYCVDMIQDLETGMTFAKALNQYKKNTKYNEKHIVKYSKIHHLYASQSKKDGAGLRSLINKVSKKVLPTSISKRVSAVLYGPKRGPSERLSKFMDDTQDRKIDKIVVARAPILSGVKTLLDGLSLGQFTKRQRDLGYDDTYHNYSLVHFAGDPPDVWTKIEKNHR